MSDLSKTVVSNPGALPSPTAHAPGISLPLRFILTGLCALAAALFLILLRPEVLSTYHYNQHVIAVTHLVVLGWIASVVMGAVYQLVPVALEARLYSERLARWQFVCHLVGVAGMVWMFWQWNLKQVGHFGSVFAFGVLLFVYNTFRTLLRVPRWNVVATAVASTLFWLSVTVLAGLLIVAGKCTYDSAQTLAPGSPLRALLIATQSVGQFAWRFDAIAAMHAHAHAGVVGVFLMLIVGVSYRLLPMFTLSELQSPRRAGLSVALLNAGLAGAFVAVALRSPWKLFFAGLLLAGFAVYAVEIIAILRARKRRTLDWGLRYFLTGIACLGLLCAAALLLAWPGVPLTAWMGQLENAYGFVALLGAVSLAIIGMLYKILPFLVWYAVYSPRIGLARVPNLADLYSHRLQQLGYWIYLAGLVAATGAILAANPAAVRVATGLLILGLLSLVLNTARMLSHLVRPQATVSTPSPKAKLPSLPNAALSA